MSRMTNRNIDTVIFDLDGTLLNTLDDLTDSVNYALQKQNMPKRTKEEIRSFVGNGIRLLIERAVKKGTDAKTLEETFKLFKEYYGEHCNDKTKPYDKIGELLQWLDANNYKTAIVSNKADFAVKELQKVYFQKIKVAIGEQEGLSTKPQPDMVEKALGILESSKSRAIYVGDSDVDIMTAKNADLYGISVLWGFRDEEFLLEHGAEHVVSLPMEIAKYLDDINGEHNYGKK